MAIKTLDELKKIRNEMYEQISLREQGEVYGGLIEVLVGMGTCGIGAGARQTIKKLLTCVHEQQLTHVKVISTDCMGHCENEPTILVVGPERETKLYGRITEDLVPDFVEKVIINNEDFDKKHVINGYKKKVGEDK